MLVEQFVKIIGADFFTGVPDSQLKGLCDYFSKEFGKNSKKHIIAANEGNAAAIAAGYHLATGKTPVVYMQNSGEGNAVNPIASLMNERVYGIPCLFVIGWRGEPNVPDEPQHIFQGQITCKMMEVLEIPYYVVTQTTSCADIEEKMKEFRTFHREGKQTAFIICKNALQNESSFSYMNEASLLREAVIKKIIEKAGEDIYVTTTGKASRELYEIRESLGQGHEHDFLTVGSMGHASSIALGIALQKPHRKIWCIDGDGALLMHMGSMAVIGQHRPENMVHVVLNNGAHESVGGMPTAALNIELIEIAKACGYPYSYSVDSEEGLVAVLDEVKGNNHLTFIEVQCAIGSRKNLGRPKTTPLENKKNFMMEISN